MSPTLSCRQIRSRQPSSSPTSPRARCLWSRLTPFSSTAPRMLSCSPVRTRGGRSALATSTARPMSPRTCCLGEMLSPSPPSAPTSRLLLRGFRSPSRPASTCEPSSPVPILFCPYPCRRAAARRRLRITTGLSITRVRSGRHGLQLQTPHLLPPPSRRAT